MAVLTSILKARPDMKALLALMTLVLLALPTLLLGAESSPPVIRPALPMPAGETAGARPYEMVWADRKPPHVPLVDFDWLEGWQVECTEGAVADLIAAQRQRVWESPTGRLVYRGTSKQSTVVFRPPSPITIPDAVSATTIWVYGNNWSWAPEPGTPRTTISLLLLDKDNAAHTLDLAQVGWKEWWLVHKVLPPSLLDKKPLRFAGIRVTGGSNKEDRELYFEDLVFFQENPAPLSFEPRPQRGIDPFPGQSPGANTGPGRLPFPTREETILPDNLTADFTTKLEQAGEGWRFTYKDADTQLEYELKPGTGFWEPVVVKLNGTVVGKAMTEAGLKFVAEPGNGRLIQAQPADNELEAYWRATVNGTEVVIQSIGAPVAEEPRRGLLLPRRVGHRAFLRAHRRRRESGIAAVALHELRRPSSECPDVQGQGPLLRLGLDGLVSFECLRALLRGQDRGGQGPIERRRPLPRRRRMESATTSSSGSS